MSAEDPAFPLQSVVIVGFGLIGGALALALRGARPGLRIVAVDSDSALALMTITHRFIKILWVMAILLAPILSGQMQMIFRHLI